MEKKLQALKNETKGPMGPKVVVHNDKGTTIQNGIEKLDGHRTAIKIDAKGKVKPVNKKLAKKAAPAKPAAPVKEAPKPAPKPPAPPQGFQFVVNTAPFAEALIATSFTRARRSSMPILGSWLVTARGGHVTVTTTNLDQASWRTLPARQVNVIQDVAIALNDYTGDLIDHWFGETVQVCINKTYTALLRSPVGHQQATVHGFDPADFPMITKVPGGTLSIPRPVLEEILVRVVPAAQTDDARPVLTTICFDLKKDALGVHLTAAAADGFRLSVLTRSGPPEAWDGEAACRILIPAKVFDTVLKVIPAGPDPKDDRISMTLNPAGNCVVFNAADGMSGVRSVCVDGAFPDYTKIIPTEKDYATYKFASLRALRQAVGFVSVYAKQSMNTVRLTYDRKSDQSTITGADAESGDAGIDVKMATRQPKRGFDIALNRRYILEGMTMVDFGEASDKTVTLSIMDKAKPVMLATANFTHVIMPMHLGDGPSAKKIDHKQFVKTGAPTPEVDLEHAALQAAVKKMEHPPKVDEHILVVRSDPSLRQGVQDVKTEVEGMEIDEEDIKLARAGADVDAIIDAEEMEEQPAGNIE